MKPLSFAETQRVIAIVDDTLEKLSFLGSITPDVLAHRDELSQFVGDEISRIIEEQRKLEHRYEELIIQRGNLKGLTNKSKYKANQAEIQDVSRALRESTKNLCRNLKDNPNVSGNLLKIQNERTKLQDLLSQTVRELREYGTCHHLIEYVEEEKNEQDKLTEIIEREKQTVSAVTQLEQDLHREKQEHEQEVRERKETIARLKEELKEIKSKAAINTKYARREAEAKSASTLRFYSQTERQIEEQIHKLKKKLKMEETVHNETVAFLTRKQEQLALEAQNWNDKYNEDMDKLENQILKMSRNREKDVERLKVLQTRWDEEVAAKATREAELRRKEELARLREEEEILQEKSAVKIQQVYRMYRLMHPASKKKKGKGKKGKGKKKKK